MRAIQAALVPPVGPELDERWQAAGGEPSLERVEIEAKSLVVRNLFEPEVRRLARVGSRGRARRARARRVTEEALRELLAHVEVYRAYLRPGHPGRARASSSASSAWRRSPSTRGPISARTIDVLERLLGDTCRRARRVAISIVRFQQVCGPVMAKGIEDTTFYRWHRLIALDEVGGDPRSLDAPDAELLHAWAQRAGRALSRSA